VRAERTGPPRGTGYHGARQATFGTPRSALLTAAAEAQILVVGSRGRGGLEGMSLGSIASALLHHSPCPVAVVHPQAAR
jgi:nucleotide-binding universal stress UspA family protein